jgi:multisubunit Na+/H+ antiporter MnhF subunit
VNSAFLLAAAVLVLALLPLTYVAMRARPEDGLLALEVAGALTTVALVCLAVGLRSSALTGVALISALMTWLGGLVFVRFMDREP